MRKTKNQRWQSRKPMFNTIHSLTAVPPDSFSHIYHLNGFRHTLNSCRSKAH